MKYLAFVAAILFLFGCASEPEQSYDEKIAAISPPANEKERQEKCGWLRSEMARQQNIAAYGASQMQGNFSLLAQIQARKNLATLESRASDFGCLAAFSNVRGESSGIDACIASCKKNTSRTSEQCFDSCNH